jgi:hypothetical protein
VTIRRCGHIPRPSRLAAGRVHNYCRIGRWYFVVIGVAAAGPCRQVIFRHLPGAHAFLEMLGESLRVGGKPYRLFGGAGHGAVVAMLAGHVEEGRDDDIGPFAAVGAHQPLDSAHFTPAGKGLVAVLGEAEIMYVVVGAMAEPDDVGIEFARGLFHLARAHHAEHAKALRPERILAAFAARRACHDDAHAEAQTEPGEHAALLVVGMRAGVHHGDGGIQTAECAVKPDQRRLGLLLFNTFAGAQHSGPPVFRSAIRYARWRLFRAWA